MKALMVSKTHLIDEAQRVMSINEDEVKEFTFGIDGVDCGDVISYNDDNYVVIVFK